jgi:hypothetical protein
MKKINKGVIGSYYYPGVENYTRYMVARFGMSPLAGDESLKPEYGPVYNNVTSFNYPITVPACRHAAADVDNRKSFFIAVMSAPGNFAKRNIIRRTWRNHYQQHKSLGLIDTAGFAFILAMTKENVTQKQIDKERAKLIEILFKWTKYRLLTLLLVSCIGCTQTGPKLILYSK